MALDMTSVDRLLRERFGDAFAGWTLTDSNVLEFRFKNPSGQKYGVVCVNPRTIPAGEFESALLTECASMARGLLP